MFAAGNLLTPQSVISVAFCIGEGARIEPDYVNKKSETTLDDVAGHSVRAAAGNPQGN